MPMLLSGMLAASLIGASPWSSAFHLVKVKEVYPGSDAAPNAQYIVLQMPAPGENFVGGQQVRIFNAAGGLVSTFTFPTHMPVGTDQATILVATPDAQMFFAVAADLTITATLPALGGKVCFADVDCAAWGGYSGSPTGVGAPENFPVGLMRGTVMRRRMDICGSPTNLDICDDTDNSENDFNSGFVPAPRNNAGVNGVVPPFTCGNSAVQSIEQCDDGNVANGDGCNATCLREATAFTPHALVVDPVAGSPSDGNGVLEPGEQAAMRPSWRNAATAPLTLTAALSTFAGPAGATYAIVDGSASYGTVAPAATASCTTDCYALSVSNPPARPVTHWDAASAEVNTNYGFQTWSLHVGDSFTDVPRFNPFYRFVETLLHRGVTGGCTATEYCPAGATTRAAMAVFVLVAKDPATNPPACGAPMFDDVPASSPFCRWIEELARRGVVSGCGGGNYCPTAPVTRAAMAVFVLRTLDPALDPPACVAGSEMFADVPAASGFCRWIEELVRRGVVTGCGGGNYCPTAPVTRQQMGVFLSVTFGLTLYGL
jgi:cysteine-rich repeat protein